ncbi:plastid division protein PDV1-like [Typha angustifolia]|uniref:plastid division protein PDV1-like n=1 Tax=Typha angustifolia TaxID=59011 RepID=UPI003C2F34BE
MVILSMEMEMEMEMEMGGIEAALERIWDLHDKISDEIHAISRAHFLKSIKVLGKSGRCGKGGADRDAGAEVEDDAAVAEAKSLNAIRTALENLEDQLEFFHFVQSQQRSERNAAIARLEQSRLVLAMILADHQGKKCKVIEEAATFVGDVHDTSLFVSSEKLYEMQRSETDEYIEDDKQQSLSAVIQMLISHLSSAKSSFRFDRIVGGFLGNAAIFGVSMLAFLRLHQVAFRSETMEVQPQSSYRNIVEKGTSQLERFPQDSNRKHLTVLLAKG